MKKRNHTLLDIVRSIMYFTNLSISFWRYVLEAAAYILNKVPSKSISSTPYEIWKEKKSNLKHLKIWGCSTCAKKEFVHKLSARAKKCRLIGYSQKHIGYLFYHLTKQTVFVSRHTIFSKKKFVFNHWNT